MNNIKKNLGKLPLNLMLIIPFLMEIFTAVGLVGWLSLRNGKIAVNDLATQLRSEISNRIEQHLTSFLVVPKIINDNVFHAIKAGWIDPKKPRSMELFFWNQVQLFPTITNVNFGNEQGRYFGVGRFDNEKGFYIQIADEMTNHNFNYYAPDQQGHLTNKILKTAPNYDPRVRPWYSVSIHSGKPKWGDIYTGFNYGILRTTYATPVYDHQNHPVGVIGADLSLSDISKFLRTLKIGKTGETFIITNNGKLVASSQPEKASSDSLNQIETIKQYLSNYFGNFSKIRGNKQLEFKLNGKELFLQVLPYQDNNGLDWLIVVVVPEDDFMGQIYINTTSTVILCIIALAIATGLGIITARVIQKPVNRLTLAYQALANGHLSQQVPGSIIKELEILADCFNQMAMQLQESFNTLEANNSALEKRVAERTIELQKAKEIADSANQAKSEFLANMSHELRTPLNGILGYAQIFQRSQDLTPKQRKGIDVIEQAGSHLLTLINDILDLAKIEARKMELAPKDFHLPSFLSGVAEISRVRAEAKDLNFYYLPDLDLPSGVCADEKRLRQILINILGNAIKFTERGNVTFHVQVLSGTPETVKIKFTIADTGVGMTPAQLEKIFLPFEQVGNSSKRAEGTGLGLTICLQLITMMNSKIQVISHQGQGSTFWFEVDFPISDKWINAATIGNNSKIIGYSGEKRRILIIDDKEVNRMVISEVLKSVGFLIDEAEDGAKGLAQVKEINPDLVITDIAMPIMDGYEFTQQVRQLYSQRELPIIACSASVSSADEGKALAIGCNDFLSKPVDMSQLFIKLEKLLKLQWEREQLDDNIHPSESTLPGLTLPSETELEKIYAALKIGDIEEVEKEARRIQTLAPEYAPFAQKLLELAAEFDEKGMIELVQSPLIEN